MNVIEALNARHSVRVFTSMPIEREKLDTIIRAASRTPSWANTQPWEVFIATGDSLGRIREGFRESRAMNTQPSPEIPRIHEWPEIAKKRLKQLNDSQRTGELSEAFKDFVVLNQEAFHAPAVLYLCMDKLFSEWGMYDLGAYSQSIMLAAKEQGLDSIPAIQLVVFPDVIRRELSIPDNLTIVVGIALGYRDDTHGINKYQSFRDPVEETVHWFE